jgi:antitoxin component of MazEF toxin-antitoxin module
MFYFNEKPSNLSSQKDLRQRSKVLNFKKAFPKEGFSWSYTGKAEFLKQASDHLRKYLGDQIGERGKRKSSRIETDRLNEAANRSESLFTMKVGKRGMIRLPEPLLKQLGLTEGDSMELAVAGGRIVEGRPALASPFDSRTITLLSRRQREASTSLTSAGHLFPRTRRGRNV